MSHFHAALSRTSLVVALVLAATACGTEPESLNVTGTWTGTTTLSISHPTTLSLLQTGVSMSGTLVIDGNVNEPFAATLNESARTIAWTVFEGCEEWSGTFTVNGDANQMSGPVAVDVSQCTSGTDRNGTIDLTKP
jgi:hypothetical protein